jgi:hypothetical protein
VRHLCEHRAPSKLTLSTPCRNGLIALQSVISIFPAGERSRFPPSSLSYRPQSALEENLNKITFLGQVTIAPPPLHPFDFGLPRLPFERSLLPSLASCAAFFLGEEVWYV